MTKRKEQKHNSRNYQDQIGRNLGIIKEEKQERLSKSKVAVFGMGGIGGACFEVLVRSGIGRFVVVDKDVFDASNLNRQIFGFRSTLGEKKVDVAERFARDINPEVEVEKFERVDEGNIGEILDGVDVIVQAIDELKPCVVVARKARELKIPLVEGWALSCGNVRVFTEDTPSLEEAYGLPSIGREISDISDEEFRKMGRDLLFGLINGIEGVAEYCTDDVITRIEAGKNPSFGPMVWFTSVLLAIEAVKVLLNWGEIAQAPNFALYDPFLHRIPSQKGSGTSS